MEKKKIIETLGEIAITLVMLAVGSLVLVTAGTFLYNMVMAIFD